MTRILAVACRSDQRTALDSAKCACAQCRLASLRARCGACQWRPSRSQRCESAAGGGSRGRKRKWRALHSGGAMDVERLQKIAGAVRTGGKGTVRRCAVLSAPVLAHSLPCYHVSDTVNLGHTGAITTLSECGVLPVVAPLLFAPPALKLNGCFTVTAFCLR